MGTLSSELADTAERLTPSPRIYADANVPAGIVTYMRVKLHWDVLFVMEDDGLRRAPDLKHYQLAEQLRRTLVTLDRDYLDDARFPPGAGAGVLVLSAPNERELSTLLDRIDANLFRRPNERSEFGAGKAAPDADYTAEALPLAGRKLHAHTDWGREE